MALILTERDNIFDYLCKNMQKHWDIKLVNLRNRIRVIADLEKWKPTLVDIWQQKQSNVKEYSVYFDNEFVCRVNSYTHPKKLEVDFLKGILELYQHQKIYFNQADYKQEDEIVKQITDNKKEQLEIANKKIDESDDDPIVKLALKELNKADKKSLKVSKEEINKIKKSL